MFRSPRNRLIFFGIFVVAPNLFIVASLPSDAPVVNDFRGVFLVSSNICALIFSALCLWSALKTGVDRRTLVVQTTFPAVVVPFLVLTAFSCAVLWLRHHMLGVPRYGIFLSAEWLVAAALYVLILSMSKPRPQSAAG